jgi:mannose-6-phosphate isomerase-like protein (cupin superfamily)
MSPVELKDYITFEVKRVYFITKPTGDTGQHCHLKEEELFVVQSGSCTAVIDKGNGLEEIKLEGPSDAMHVGNYVWHGFKDLSSDLVLLAISSTNYNPNRDDYIEDYKQYKEVQKNLIQH